VPQIGNSTWQSIRFDGRVLAFFILLALSFHARAQTKSPQIYLQCLTNFRDLRRSPSGTRHRGIPDAGYGVTETRAMVGFAATAESPWLRDALRGAADDPKFTNRLNRFARHETTITTPHRSYNTSPTNGLEQRQLATCTSQSGSTGMTAKVGRWSGLPAGPVQPAPLTVAGVQAVVITRDASRFSIPPCTRILSDGETKAEENGWTETSLRWLPVENKNGQRQQLL